MVYDSFSWLRENARGKTYTLPKTNIASENRPGPKRKGSSSNHHFQGRLLLVSGRYDL